MQSHSNIHPSTLEPQTSNLKPSTRDSSLLFFYLRLILDRQTDRQIDPQETQKRKLRKGNSKKIQKTKDIKKRGVTEGRHRARARVRARKEEKREKGKTFKNHASVTWWCITERNGTDGME
ncbi:hypothetical protein BTUL_0166g00050 [Botrytis tulipae]|uniref:Uncharacterized protein n=1 Tax=Botrytis tulipae TaxID=87230 RepID=A0A4Z1EDZ1_9HELO|nr:hypothetical protein BTUL_0166g00050 [Botrytis tulipae]